MIEGGGLTAEAVVASCLERIAEREPVVRAWAYLAGEAALARARAFDRAGKKTLLGGVPFGLKDIFDAAEMPATYGSPIYTGWWPPSDCQCRGPAKSGGRHPARQDHHDRVRQPPTRTDLEPARPRLHPRRLVERLGGGGRRFHGAVGDRDPNRRLGDPAGGLLRRGRVQAELWAVSAGRHADQHRNPRHGRHHGALGRRHRALPRGDDGDPV